MSLPLRYKHRKMVKMDDETFECVSSIAKEQSKPVGRTLREIVEAFVSSYRGVK